MRMIKHDVLCINTSRVPKDVLITEAEDLGFHLTQDPADVNALKTEGDL